MAQAQKNRAQRRATQTLVKKKQPNVFENIAVHGFEHVQVKPIEIVKIPELSLYQGEARQKQQQALEFLKKADFQKSVEEYERIYQDNPEDIDTANMLGALYVHLFENDKAVKLLRAVTLKNKDDYIALNNLAACYMRQFAYEKAEKPLIKALKLSPNTAEIHHNCGVYYQRQGQNIDALKGYKNAIHLKPGAESYCGAGLVSLSLREYAQAENIFKQALALKADSDIAYYGLYLCHALQNNHQDALLHVAKCVTLKPNHHIYASAFVECALSVKKASPSKTLLAAMVYVLRYGKVQLNRLFNFWHALFLNSGGFPEIKALIEKKPQSLSKEDYDLILPELEKEFFQLGVANLILSSPEFENLMTILRRFFLENLENAIEIPPAFLYALSIQCFFNEYVYSVSDDEQNALNSLEEKIKNEKEISESRLTLYTCYRPLFKSGLEDIFLKQQQRIKSSSFDQLLTVHIHERRQEEEIKPAVKTFGKITNTVSTAVKSMYEENPYPRWRHLVQPDEETLMLLEKSRKKAKRKILIAGCGTGQQSIGVAYMNKNASITAIDLSSASLAYAIRKTKEVGLTNIHYYMGDLLEVAELGKNYDEIHSAGVLHHMKDPMEGWRLLTTLLKPGGTMEIGLYSEMARQPVVAVREYIAENKIETSNKNIQKVRDYIRTLPPQDAKSEVMDFLDFYTTSSCRDLLFHVQEHRFTLPQIQDCLDELGLEFRGFRENHVLRFFQEKYTDPQDLTDLNKWHAFEQETPKTFLGMYQMILHKPL